MSSSSSSSDSSSSSSTSSSSGNGNGGNYGEYEGPSRSRRRAVNEIWPEPFIEALATQVAIDASRLFGRLAAAQAIVNVFQVCSTWRAVSRSDLLWHHLTRRIWGRTTLLHQTWHEEFIYRHRTARNFRTGTYSHFTLHFDPADVDDPNDPDAPICRCMALSDQFLACGFADGAVRLFDVTTRHHARTFRPQHRDRLGRFSRAVSGIIINDTRLVFATLDGDIHEALLNSNTYPRRVHYGDVVSEGALIDFTGRGQWWVGLHAGVPGRAFQIWDANTEQLTFVGGVLTDPDSVRGWHTLTELSDIVGRVRILSRESESAVACTSLRLIEFELRNQGGILREEGFSRGNIVGCFDVWKEAYMVVDNRGMAKVRSVDSLGNEKECRFNVRPQRGMMGCINGGYALICAGGGIRVWDREGEEGEYVYSIRERIGEIKGIVADERHVAVASNDATIHIWDFGGQ
ncbi:Transducin/WD40 repeat-like superfamily protein [Euphorbia peplus]|nr:Transducin/WD40 repeat-like superfamily protein [Euphorbia peplus]